MLTAKEWLKSPSHEDQGPSKHVAMTATYHIPQPEPFDFASPEEWTKWLQRFERFHQASRLTEKSEEAQVNTLIYCIGDHADDIQHTFKLSVEDAKKYQVVSKFKGHFVKHWNVIFKWAKFNHREQEPGEPVDDFITALYALTKHCNYGTLHDEMVHDRIVVGIIDSSLSEKLQLDADLTLQQQRRSTRQRNWKISTPSCMERHLLQVERNLICL